MTTAKDVGRASDRGGRLVDGEFLFTHDDFRKIAAMLHSDAGIALPESKATLDEFVAAMRDVHDAGMADPQALVVANAAKDAYDFLGSPEGELALAQALQGPQRRPHARGGRVGGAGRRVLPAAHADQRRRDAQGAGRTAGSGAARR